MPEKVSIKAILPENAADPTLSLPLPALRRLKPRRPGAVLPGLWSLRCFADAHGRA